MNEHEQLAAIISNIILAEIAMFGGDFSKTERIISLRDKLTSTITQTFDLKRVKTD
jgi:hypothetical protein